MLNSSWPTHKELRGFLFHISILKLFLLYLFSLTGLLLVYFDFHLGRFLLLFKREREHEVGWIER